jgi:molybdenum-dependent DNA-binding transcriptional regulator ModE
MNLEIRHLKLVEAVAETGSVTRAGHRLHLTQSALSHQLRDAEEQLGVALFDRKNGRMRLTSAGEQLLETARMVLTELERAGSEIQRSNRPARGRLRISTQCHTAYHWFPPRLLLFQRKFPNVEVQLVLEPPGYRWHCSVAQLRDNSPPDYLQEFVRIIADRPMLADFFPRTRNQAGHRRLSRHAAAQPISGRGARSHKRR